MDTPQRSTTGHASPHDQAECTAHHRSFRDALEVVSGKWTSVLLLSLGYKGSMRFKELQRAHAITAKTLSKELKELEMNGLVTRTVLDTMPVTVSYAITPYGRTLEAVLEQLRAWGVQHRERVRNNGPVKRRVARAVGAGTLQVVG